MSQVEEKLAQSLTAESTALLPFLPYLLQDLWALGSLPEDIIRLVSRFPQVWDKTRVLDLACGKGAVAVHLAKTMGCVIKGIDLMPEFIQYANQKAGEYGVSSRCEFVTGDINEAVDRERGYDMVIMTGVDIEVLGQPLDALIKLKNTINAEGWMILEEVCDRENRAGKYLSHPQWLELLQQAGLKVMVEDVFADEDMAAMNKVDQAYIVKRANELKEQYPQHAALFEDYIQSQQAECDELENEVVCLTWLLEKK